MNFGEAIKSVFSKYATFSGRARRSEFWYFFLFCFLVNFVLELIPFLSIVSGLWALAVLIPNIAVSVRRLHDIGKSGWTYLYFFLPSFLLIVYIFYFVIRYALPYINAGYTVDAEFISDLLENDSISTAIIGILSLVWLVASIIFIVWMTREGQIGWNRWGQNPKEQSEIGPQDLY